MIQSSYSAYQVSPYTYTATASTGVAAAPTQANGNAYGQDSYVASQQGFDPHQQAGTMKRMMNGIGNAFGRMADWVGLGTISHYAKQNFQAHDADRSNDLNAQEFSAVSSLIAKSFQEVDSNANQQISFGEFKRIVGDLVDAQFKALDTSQDGFLNYSETAAGGYVVVQGNQDSFVRHDANQDGLLSRNEFAGLLNDTRLRRQ